MSKRLIQWKIIIDGIAQGLHPQRSHPLVNTKDAGTRYILYELWWSRTPGFETLHPRLNNLCPTYGNYFGPPYFHHQVDGMKVRYTISPLPNDHTQYHYFLSPGVVVPFKQCTTGGSGIYSPFHQNHWVPCVNLLERRIGPLFSNMPSAFFGPDTEGKHFGGKAQKYRPKFTFFLRWAELITQGQGNDGGEISVRWRLSADITSNVAAIMKDMKILQSQLNIADREKASRPDDKVRKCLRIWQPYVSCAIIWQPDTFFAIAYQTGR